MSAERRRRGETAFAGRSLRRAIDVRIQLLPGRWVAPDVRPIPINLNLAPAQRDRVGHKLCVRFTRLPGQDFHLLERRVFARYRAR